MNNNIPENFVTICKIAGFAPEKIQEAWVSLQKKILTSFFQWLEEKGQLTETQATKMLEVLKNDEAILAAGGIWETLAPILDDSQLTLTAKALADFFVTGLEEFYASIQGKMTVEQQQVVNAYIDSDYARTTKN